MKLKTGIILALLFSLGLLTAAVGVNKNELPTYSETVEATAFVDAPAEEEDKAPEEASTEQICTENAGIEGRYDHDVYQQCIEQLAKDHGAVGVAAALVENGKVIDTFSYGEAVKGELPMTDNTKLRVASISKVFLGIATMLSAEDGTMSLDTDIGRYWGFELGTHAENDVITPRTLLTHTSSLYDPDDIESTLYYTMADRLRSGSGIRTMVSGNINNYYYNNYAMDVLGMTVELANNKTLDSLLGERLYTPLGIDASFYPGDLRDTADVANLYQCDGSVGIPASRMTTWHGGAAGSQGWAFAGGLTTSVKDLGKIVALLANDGVYDGTRYLSEESVNEMEYHEGNYNGECWQCQPLCYETNKYGQAEFYYHTGSAYGVFNLIGYNPVTGRGVAVLTNGAYRGVSLYGEIAELLMSINAN